MGEKGMSLDELVQMMMKELTLANVRDGQDMPIIIRSGVEDYFVADFSIRQETSDGKRTAIIEMGDAKP